MPATRAISVARPWALEYVRGGCEREGSRTLHQHQPVRPAYRPVRSPMWSAHASGREPLGQSIAAAMSHHQLGPDEIFDHRPEFGPALRLLLQDHRTDA